MSPRRTADIGLVAVFLAGLGYYSAACLLNVVRDPAGPAVTSLRALPATVEAFVTDRVAFRDRLLWCHALVRTHWLGASTTPRVWLGRDGWLFYNHHADPEYLKAGDPALPARADQWAAALSNRRAWLAARGVRFLAVAVPDKQTVYPEFVPPAGRRRGPSPLDEMIARCRRDPELTVLDLREPLRAAKTAGDVYLRTDTHWNDRGAYAGYAATVRALAEWYPSLTPIDCDVTDSADRLSGDLAWLAGQGGRLTETPPVLVRPRPRATLTTEVPDYKRESTFAHVVPQVWSGGDPAGPRVVLMGDSFANDLYADLLAQHCPRLVRVGAYEPHPELIDREQPDVVVWVFVERMVEGYGLK